MVLAGLVAAPLSASAQDTDKGWVEEFYPELAPRESPQAPPPEPVPKEPVSEPAPEEPALQLKLDDAAVEVVPPPPRTPDGYTLEEMDVRVRRARIALGLTTVPIFVGFILTTPALTFDFCLVDCPPPPTAEEQAREDRLVRAGVTIAVLGGASMIAMGILLGVRKRAWRELKQAHYGTRRRVQWDLARSRLVF